jgi:hypothetical protein
MPTIFAVVEHTSKTAFYVAGGLLAAWAVLIGVIGVTFVLMAAAMATAVATA